MFLMDSWGKDIGDSLTLGFEIVLPTLLGALLGYLLDRYFGTWPIIMIMGLFLGAALGFFMVVYKFVLGSDNKEKR